MIDLSNDALDALVGALRSGEQADMDGMMVRVSRQACEEAATTITALRAREAAIVAAAFEVLCNVLYCCDTEAQAIANRISGPRGERNRCPDGVQVLEDAETIIRAAAALVTPSDSTAALARIVREAEARGMERAAARARVYASNYEQSSDGRNTFILLAEWADAEAAAILARAAGIEKEGGA